MGVAFAAKMHYSYFLLLKLYCTIQFYFKKKHNLPDIRVRYEFESAPLTNIPALTQL